MLFCDQVDLGELSKKLKKDGVDPGCTDDEKIAYLWNLYVKTEVRYYT